MSLPNYLAKIKSAGMYRFTFDKSQIPAASAETMRLVVGYSEKGPFNNPVYIDNKADFINLFGNVNKRLEKKGVFFHRMALQALSAGPILALNLKPFGIKGEPGTMEEVNYVSFNPCDVSNNNSLNTRPMNVIDIFDRDRFWSIDPDKLPEKIGDNSNYINIAAIDSKEQSCSFFIRKCNYNSVREYDVTVRDWYNNLGEEMPEYLVGFETALIRDFFAEVYLFRGEFTSEMIEENGVLSKYFENGSLKTNYTNTFGYADALDALADDTNSNLVGIYRGCLLPYFKDLFGNYVSLDILFNADKDTHKMIMKLNDSIIDEVLDTVEEHNNLTHWNAGWSQVEGITVNSALRPTYVSGYTYHSIERNESAGSIYDKAFGVLKTETGIFKALTNHVDSEYHYLIDTFATVVRANTNNTIGDKCILAEIAKTKDNCLAILNFPSLKELSAKVGSSFDINNIKNYFTLPGESQGASYCAFFTPLTFGDGPVKTIVPSAALVSNNFMEKWNSRQPYYIVAGPNYGVMSYDGLIGPDYNYSRTDLDALEPLGVNCMVYVPRKGTYINSNQTAKQTPASALSKIHVRELVIYLQNEIEAMMENYQWEMNTQTLRDTIKTKADTLLDRIKANGGVYDYINVCDGTNNTPEVIDNEMVILDTSIEPSRGAGKMVQRLTIHRTGGISSLTK